MKKKICLLSLLSLAYLSGCGNQSFDCPYQEGLRCMRLSEVDRQIDRPNDPKVGGLRSAESPSSLAEPTLRVWLAPYQSQEGLEHEQHWIHFVARQEADSADALKDAFD